jgi:hypothetical protein
MALRTASRCVGTPPPARHLATSPQKPLGEVGGVADRVGRSDQLRTASESAPLPGPPPQTARGSENSIALLRLWSASPLPQGFLGERPGEGTPGDEAGSGSKPDSPTSEPCRARHLSPRFLRGRERGRPADADRTPSKRTTPPPQFGGGVASRREERAKGLAGERAPASQTRPADHTNFGGCASAAHPPASAPRSLPYRLPPLTHVRQFPLSPGSADGYSAHGGADSAAPAASTIPMRRMSLYQNPEQA